MGVRGRKKKTVVGDGFFDDIGNAFKSVGQAVLPIATNIASSVITKKLGGKGKRGASITAPGMRAGY